MPRVGFTRLPGSRASCTTSLTNGNPASSIPGNVARRGYTYLGDVFVRAHAGSITLSFEGFGRHRGARNPWRHATPGTRRDRLRHAINPRNDWDLGALFDVVHQLRLRPICNPPVHAGAWNLGKAGWPRRDE